MLFIDPNIILVSGASWVGTVIGNMVRRVYSYLDFAKRSNTACFWRKNHGYMTGYGEGERYLEGKAINLEAWRQADLPTAYNASIVLRLFPTTAIYCRITSNIYLNLNSTLWGNIVQYSVLRERISLLATAYKPASSYVVSSRCSIIQVKSPAPREQLTRVPYASQVPTGEYWWSWILLGHKTGVSWHRAMHRGP